MTPKPASKVRTSTKASVKKNAGNGLDWREDWKVWCFSGSPTSSPTKYWALVLALLVLESCFTALILYKIPYTEIDWRAYMQEVEGFLNGIVDYAQLRGDTGPLVYPAGFVYIYSILYYITDHGENIFRAQLIFAVFYLIVLGLTLKVYSFSRKMNPLWIILLFGSKRIRSIFYLRLFNDPIASGVVLLAIWALLAKRYQLSSGLLSMALSIKMNVLLFLPGFLLLYFQALGFRGLLKAVLTIPLIQALIAYPFWPYWKNYLHGAFDFSRIFFYKWTVNWKFVSEELFLSRPFHTSLLIIHMSTLLLFLFFTWCKGVGGVISMIRDRLSRKAWNHKASLDPDHILIVLFTCNFVGILFSRSLHYQFYSWYFFTLPYVLARSKIPNVLKVSCYFIIEWCWNVYPATHYSSLVFFVVHGVVLIGLVSC